MAKSRRGSIINRRHLARKQRERIQINYITIVSIVIVALVVILVGVALVLDQVIQPRQPVAIVNGVEISTREFQSRVRFARNNLVNQYAGLLQTMQQFGGDESTQAFFQNQLRSIEFQLTPETIGRDVLNILIDEELIRQEAAARGIRVTDQEVSTAVDEFFGYFGGGPRPTSTMVPTSLPTSTLSPLQMTLTAPTATPTLTTTVAITETTGITPTNPVTETTAISETLAVTETLESTPTAIVADTTPITPTATPTPFTRAAFEATAEASYDFLESRLGFTRADLRRMVEADLLRQRLREEVTSQQAREQEQVWARHILVADEETARAALDRLESGEEFAALAAELSQDTATAALGGDLGWFSSRAMVEEFESAAFSLEIGEISEPVSSQFGFHIIQALGHEVRPLSAQEYEQLKDTLFRDWLSEVRMQADTQTLDYWTDRIPISPDLASAGLLPQQIQPQQIP